MGQWRIRMKRARGLPGNYRPLTARMRILAWILVMMTAALATVAFTTYSILLRQGSQVASERLRQDAREFVSFAHKGRDPRTGGPFTSSRQVLSVHLGLQDAVREEELVGVVRGREGALDVLRQPRQIHAKKALYKDRSLLRRMADSSASSGSLGKGADTTRWIKINVTSPREPHTRGTYVIGYHLGVDRAAAYQTLRLLLMISAASLILVAGVGWLVAGRILAPLRDLRDAATQLTEQGLNRRIRVRGHDELSALAATFNAMTDRLEQAFLTQRRFVDDAGHELRTPITIVQGHLELMGDGPDEREETVRLVTDELGRMSRIVEDLLLLAKAERPDFVRPCGTHLAELTADIYVKVRTLGDRRWELEQLAEAEAHLDPQRITQAMVQLTQNAVQYTKRGDVIRIGSRVDSLTGAAELWVADTGQGVPPAESEVIFQRFRRGVGISRQQHGTGAGLGLAIVRAITAGHQGHVRLDATPGGGATFVLTLPGPGQARIPGQGATPSREGAAPEPK